MSTPFYIIKKTDNCMKHTFNGTIIAIYNNKPFFIVDDIKKYDILNIYRNSNEPKSPCNISYKYIDIFGNVMKDKPFGNIFSNEPREDPKAIIKNNKLYISYNLVDIIDDIVQGVSVSKILLHFYNKKVTCDGVEVNFNMNEHNLSNYKLNKYEKNWLFIDDKIIYTLYPLKIINEDGTTFITKEWLHPYDKDKQLYYKNKPILNKNLNTYKHFQSSNSIFYVSKFYFDIRSGTFPILLNNIYYIFAHSREYPGETYRLILILLDINMNIKGFTYPFNMDELGLSNDERILYPSGAIFDKLSDTWYVCCGLGDKDQVILNIPNEFLMEKIIYYDDTKHATKHAS